jgi:hypothetical protein
MGTGYREESSCSQTSPLAQTQSLLQQVSSIALVVSCRSWKAALAGVLHTATLSCCPVKSLHTFASLEAAALPTRTRVARAQEPPMPVLSSLLSPLLQRPLASIPTASSKAYHIDLAISECEWPRH